jgi:lipoyl(octanoyl) transferase
VPCGIAEAPVTSLDEMGVFDGQTRFDTALRQELDNFLSALEGRIGTG